MHISFHQMSLKNKINQERLYNLFRIYTRRRQSTLVQTQTEKWLSVSAGNVMRAAAAPGQLIYCIFCVFHLFVYYPAAHRRSTDRAAE